MAEFGWAYLSGAVTGGGPSGSVQYVPTYGGALTGSKEFTWNDTRATLFVSGTMIVSGTIKANVFDVIQTNRIEVNHYGNTVFGNDAADTHQISGSLFVSGGVLQNYVKVTTAAVYVVPQSSGYIVGVSGSGYKSIRLPGAKGMGAGRIVVIKDEYGITRSKSAGTHIAISASGGDKIDHQTTFDIEGDSVALSLYSDGNNKWFIY